jgi:hypothetical protein
MEGPLRILGVSLVTNPFGWADAEALWEINYYLTGLFGPLFVFKELSTNILNTSPIFQPRRPTRLCLSQPFGFFPPSLEPASDV